MEDGSACSETESIEEELPSTNQTATDLDVSATKQYRYHLSASRIAQWLGVDSYDPKDDRCHGSASGRQALLDEWTTPRARTERTGNPNPRLELGKRSEPRAIDAFKALSALSDDEVRKPVFVEHPTKPWLGAKPDALLGTNAVLEIKTPWAARDDPDRPVELAIRHLLQVWMQLVCTGREFAYVVAYSGRGEHLHLWKVTRDERRFHHRHRTNATFDEHLNTTSETFDEPRTLWEVCEPEFDKYRDAVLAGNRVHPINGAIKVIDQERIRRELRAYHRHAVHRLTMRSRATAGGPRWAPASAERANDPYKWTQIDRVANPLKNLTIRPNPTDSMAVSRYLRVYWTDYANNRYWKSGDGPPPGSGGFIGGEYYTDTTTMRRADLACGAEGWGVKRLKTA